MLGWPKCVHRKTTKRNPFHSRLFLERLETRDTPSCPTLTLTTSIVAGTDVSLTGQVTCKGSPTNAVVTFTGIINDSTVPNPDGSYALMEEASGLGTVTAQVTDWAGRQSAILSATISTAAPTITLSYSYGAGGAVTLSGQVSAQTSSNLTVTFSGAVNDTTQTDSNGNFSYTTATQVTGTVSATTTDCWGQGSSAASVTLSDTPPTITNFQAIAGTDNIWTFQGQVSATYAPGMTVQLSGIPTLNGSTGYTAVTVDANGNFSLTVQLQNGEGGTVCAQTWDWLGVASNVATNVVTPTVSAQTSFSATTMC